MRKLLSIMLVFFMLFGIIPTAFAQQPKANDVELLKHDITLAQNEEAHLYLKTTPAGGVEWKSSNEWVVEVNSRGDVRANGIGIAIVTVTSNDTGNSDIVRVTVTDHYIIYDSFDWGLGEWGIYDYDDDGFTWIRASDYDEPVQTLGWDAALCASYYPTNGDRLNSDDYLISSEFDIPYDVKTAELRFAVGGLYSDYYTEDLYVYMNKDVSDLSDLKANQIKYVPVNSDYMEITVDLTQFIGWENLTLAFRYVGDDKAGIWLDNAGIYIQYEKIDEIVITNADITPVAGENADDHLTYSIPSNAHYSVDEHIWWDYTNNNEFHGSFAAGDEYEAGWIIYADDGYEFFPDCTVTINGTAEIDWDYSSIYTYGTCYEVWTAPTVCEGEGELTVIPKIELSDVLLTAPEGELAGDYLTVNVPSNANYAVTDVYWHDDTTNTWVKNDETFISGHEYSTQFYVKPNDGYKFDDTTELYINGSKDNVDLYYSDIMSDGKYEVWTYPSVCGADLITISNVDITDVTLEAPEGGRVGDYLTANVPSDAPYTVEKAEWFSDASMYVLNEEHIFTAGDTYALCIVVVPKTGYKIADDVKVTINGSEDNVDWSASGVTPHGDKLGAWTFPKVCGEVEDKVIDTINVFNVDTQPIAGDMANQHMGYTLPADAHYKVVDIVWYNCDTENTIEPVATFEEGVMYQIVFTVAPEEGYKIATDAALLINGGDVDAKSYIHEAGEFARIGSIPQDAMQPADVTGVILHNTEMTMHVGENSALSWEVVPANAKNKNVTFSSSDESVAKVDDHGMVWAIGAGSAVITITTEEGGFTATCAVTVLDSGSPSVTVGDCNGDGKINTSDAVMILKFAAGMVGLDANQQTAADTNKDDKVNTSDAVLILKYAAGMITEF